VTKLHFLGCAACSIAWVLAGCSKPAPPQPESTATHEQETADTGEAKPPAPPAEPPQAHGTVTIKVKNEADADRFYFFTRSRSQNLSIEQLVNGEWVALAYEPPTCTVACPADGSKPTCKPCYPATPRPSVGKAADFELTWWGLTYESVRGVQDWCFCHRASAALPGKYRATLTTSPKAVCDVEPCAFDDYGVARGTVNGDPMRSVVEFELTAGEQNVVIPIE